MNEQDLLKHELRGAWLGMPAAYHPFDFIGAGMGAYFLWDGARYRRPTSWISISLGAIMMYIHTQRFFYAPQDQAGLYRLLNALEIRPDDIRA